MTAAHSGARPRRVGFLFNHEALHQIAHSAPIAFELAALDSAIEVLLIATSTAQYEHLRTLAARHPGSRCQLIQLELPAAWALAAPLLDPLMPYRRIAMLRAHRALFATLDALVVPEKTSLWLRTRFGLDRLKFVHTRHGAGDREVGFDRASGQFDLVLLSGPKVRDRLQAAGLLREHAMVGYAKFDLVRGTPRPRLFDNDRPTVVYNPHFSPAFSSWFRMGRAVLDYFRESTRYNLIFAPHVMLFRKRLHTSLKPFAIAPPGAVPMRHAAPHLLIDPGSARSVDMSYTRAGDLYLGDASSQIYEFLLEPRPCLFLDAQGTRWQDDPNYAHWQAGPVLDRIDRLDAALTDAFASHEQYRERQQQMFAYSFALTDEPSARRGARAIRDYVQALETGANA